MNLKFKIEPVTYELPLTKAPVHPHSSPPSLPFNIIINPILNGHVVPLCCLLFAKLHMKRERKKKSPLDVTMKTAEHM